jgi:hypothetical protein
VTELRGVRCQGETKAGDRCSSRAYEYVRVIDGKSFRDIWLCGRHQGSERKRGLVVRMIRKWTHSTRKGATSK